jgi:hypothetical protein
VRETRLATRVLQQYPSYQKSLYVRGDECWWRIIDYDRELPMTTFDRNDMRNFIVREIARQLNAPPDVVNVYKYLQDTLERRVIDLERRLFELENRAADAKKTLEEGQ